MQQHDRKYSARRPPPHYLNPLTMGLGSKGQNSTFSEHGHVAYKIKGNHGSKYFASRPHPSPTPALGMGSIGQSSTFSGHSHVAFQIKGNHKCSSMVGNILSADPPHYPDHEVGVTRPKFVFSEHCHVAYQIKCNHILQQHGSKYFATDPHTTDLGVVVKRSKFNLLRTWSCCISN